MKDYINLFHSIVSDIHFWQDLSRIEKEKKISHYLENFKKIDYLVDYFDNFEENLKKKSLNSYLNSVISS